MQKVSPGPFALKSYRYILSYPAIQLADSKGSKTRFCMARPDVCITKTRLYNFDPLKPHFYLVKLGFTVVNIICLVLLENLDCGCSLEPPRRGGSKE